MNNLFTVFGLMIFAYFLGGIPTSYIFGKVFKKIDIRKYGSGNVGATNALRVLGAKMGIITLIIDIGKGFLPVFISKIIFKRYHIPANDIYFILIGLSAIFGHIFSIYLSFKGGKGVATSAGVFLSLIPIPFLAAFVSFFIIVTLSKYVSLGSIVASVVLVIAELIDNFGNSFSNVEYLVFTVIIALFIIIRHKSNIQRLIKGNENKISFKRK